MPADCVWIAHQSKILIIAKYVGKVQGAECDFYFYMIEIRDGCGRLEKRK